MLTVSAKGYVTCPLDGEERHHQDCCIYGKLDGGLVRDESIIKFDCRCNPEDKGMQRRVPTGIDYKFIERRVIKA